MLFRVERLSSIKYEKIRKTRIPSLTTLNALQKTKFAKTPQNPAFLLHKFQLHVPRQVVSLGLLAIPGLHVLQSALMLE